MAKKKKAERILFFIEGAIATDEEQKAFDAMGAGAVMRRADLVLPTECPEKCDGVAGCVPEPYASLFGEAATKAEPKPNVGKTEKPKAPAQTAWKPNA